MKLQLDQLEARDCPSLTPVLSAGVLSVTDSHANDYVYISQPDANHVQVDTEVRPGDGSVATAGALKSFTFDANAIKSIALAMGQGSAEWLYNETAIPCQITAAGPNNYVSGQSSNSTVKVGDYGFISWSVGGQNTFTGIGQNGQATFAIAGAGANTINGSPGGTDRYQVIDSGGDTIHATGSDWMYLNSAGINVDCGAGGSTVTSLGSNVTISCNGGGCGVYSGGGGSTIYGGGAANVIDAEGGNNTLYGSSADALYADNPGDQIFIVY